MNLSEWEELIDGADRGSEVSVELYTRSEVRHGQLFCPAGSRLSDLLNDSFTTAQEAETRFLGFVPAPVSGENKPREYVRKSAIDLLAVSDGNLGRGMGTQGSGSHHLYQEKSPALLILELSTYTLIGNMHCGHGQTVEDVLNDDNPFLPLTDVTMVRDNRFYGNRPFVAVNKHEVISCREDR